MDKQPNTLSVTGLQFFGQISASISHEIKNELAIINENAGLLEDFALMADREIPIDPERLKTMAAALKKQIGRADAIINNMNRFAHSIDHSIATIDLARTVELVIALTARFAAMKGVRVDLLLPDNPVAFRTAPYFLMNLLWLCLEFSMSASGDEKWVELFVEETEKDVRFQFRRLTDLNDGFLKTFPSEREKYLLDALAADLTIEPDRKKIILRLARGSE